MEDLSEDGLFYSDELMKKSLHVSSMINAGVTWTVD